MRDYGKVSPQFWTGRTGKGLRGNVEAQVVALYLMTSPHANMIGVYHLPMLYLAHETGLSPEGASKGLQACISAGFCVYDEDAECVFVVEMAAHQVGEVLKQSDLRAKSIDRLYKGVSSPILAAAFFVRYGEPFNLSSPLQAPSEGHAKGLYKPHSPAPAPAPVSDLEKKQRRTKSAEVTLAAWVAGLGDADAVPADDPIFGWAQTAGIPGDWIGLAWWAFEARYESDPKTYTDWRAVFRRAVREDWLRIWKTNRDGTYSLTTAGEMCEREMRAAA